MRMSEDSRLRLIGETSMPFVGGQAFCAPLRWWEASPGCLGRGDEMRVQASMVFESGTSSGLSDDHCRTCEVVKVWPLGLSAWSI